MIVLNLLLSFLLQIAFTIGVIVLFGLLIALCNRLFYSNFGSKSRIVCYVTGCIGTPIHELSHALFCLIFGHKITEIKLFQINSTDGTLGYVNHTYNPKNIYHKIGNFFIGIAPIIAITAILYLLAYLIIPEVITEIRVKTNGISLSNGIVEVLGSIGSVIMVFFTSATLYKWWIFVVVGMLLALHMNLSKADIKGAISGLLVLLLAVLLVDIILALVGNGLLDSFTNMVMRLGGYLISFLSLSLIISVIAVLLSFIYKVTIGRKLR